MIKQRNRSSALMVLVCFAVAGMLLTVVAMVEELHVL